MTRDEAIAAIEESRDTHLAWLNHLRAGCEECNRPETIALVGDVEHHTRCVSKYADVLELLREAA